MASSCRPPATGHQLGFNDLKIIEAHAFLRAIAEGREAVPSSKEALHFEAVIHAIAEAAETGARVRNSLEALKATRASIPSIV